MIANRNPERRRVSRLAWSGHFAPAESAHPNLSTTTIASKRRSCAPRSNRRAGLTWLAKGVPMKTNELSQDRRRFLARVSAIPLSLALPGISTTAHAADAKGAPTLAAFGPFKRIDAGDLNVAYAEAGPADGAPVLLLHGWPYDIHTYVDVAPLLASKGYHVIVPYLRGYGGTRFRADNTLRNGQQAALAVDTVNLLDALRIDKALVGGCDWGARTADIVAALWPQRVKALVSVSGYLIGSQELNRKPLPPTAELQWWYQYYFATERGRAGYDQYRREFAKLIWQTASPKWRFDDATFERSATAFDNPDHVAITVHNYRWRLGLAQGETRYDELESKLARFPPIEVPTITLEGDANGAPHVEPGVYAKMFNARYEHRLITGGIGHNLPQESPQAFAQSIIDVDRF
jgi:pimeloyl-ACP methyl ester carboxylesterase